MIQDSRLKYHIEMYESTPYVELMFQATVPIPCPGCSLTVPVVGHVGLTVSSCSLTFTAADANSTQQTLSIRALQTAGRNARILSLKFGSIVATGSPWHGLTLPKILVYYNLLTRFALHCNFSFSDIYVYCFVFCDMYLYFICFKCIRLFCVLLFQ